MKEDLPTIECPSAGCWPTSSLNFSQQWMRFRQAQSCRLVFWQNRFRFIARYCCRTRWIQIVLPICYILFSYPFVQAQSVEFLPEVDGYLKLDKMLRVYYEAKDDRDGGDSTQFTTGPSLQMYVGPLFKLKKINSLDLDDSKPRALVLEAGYRFITAPNEPNDNRLVVAATSHFPLKAGFLVTDRNRADLDWKGGKANWRYRNKLTLERTLTIHSYHPIPYVAFEPYYESQYDKWSTTTEFAGCLLPVGRHVEFNPYYEHENDTGKHPNVSINFIGLAVYFFFSVEGKKP